MSDREAISATLNSIESSVGANELSAYQVFKRMKRLVQAAKAGGAANLLAKNQDCGCVVCTCENDERCMGCGAKHCGSHPVGQMPNPRYEQAQAGKPIAAVHGWFHGECVIRPLDPEAVLPAGMALYSQPQAQAGDGGHKHPDYKAVENFAEAMKLKMDRSREKGRGGWDDPLKCSGSDLATMLVAHVAKGDPVDIANFCMMIHQRGIAPYEIQTAFRDYLADYKSGNGEAPVAWLCDAEDGVNINATCSPLALADYKRFGRKITPLYTAPPAAAVNQQLLEALVAVRSCMAIGIPEFSLHDREVMTQADNAIDAAIAAAQEQSK